jgi:hypothetical protein
LGDPAYAPGVGALVNSLLAAGFRDEIWVRWVGDLPHWAAPARFDADGIAERALPGGAILRFVRAERPPFSPSWLKADFLLETAERSTAEQFVFFDADIVVLYDWAFFQSWLGPAIAVCMDCHDPHMPEGHPRKRAWAELAAELGHPWHPAAGYYNAGFYAVPRSRLDFLRLHVALNREIRARRIADDSQVHSHAEPTWFAFRTGDQDALNVALHIDGGPLSALGPNGMGFADFGGNPMLHAIYSPKPWDRRYGLRTAVRGAFPSRVDLAYWDFVSTPLEVFPPAEVARRKRAIRWANRASLLLAQRLRESYG